MREVFTLTQDHNGRWAVAIGPERAMREHRRFSKAARASKENSRYQVIATVRPVRVLRFRRPDHAEPIVRRHAKEQKAKQSRDTRIDRIVEQTMNEATVKQNTIDKARESVAERMKKAREARAAKAKAAAENRI